MRKKNLLSSLLVAAGLCVGTSASAEVGDVTTNADIDFSNGIVEGVVTGTVNKMLIDTAGEGGAASYIQDGWLRTGDKTSVVTIGSDEYAGSRDVVTFNFKMAFGNKNNMGEGFRIKDVDGENIATFQLARWDGKGANANTLGIDMSGLYGSAYNNAPILDRYTSFTITIDYAAKLITSVVSCTNPNATKTFSVSLSNENPVASFEVFGYGVDGNTDRANAFDDLKITTTEGNYDVTSASYTVNYVCGSTIFKTEERTGDVGSEIVLLAADTQNQIIDDVKYIYLENDAEGKIVADDGSTVVTVKFREAEVWNYSVSAVADGTNLAVITNGTVWEGENVFFNYSQYIAVDGNLYKSERQSANPWWGLTFTPSANNEEKTVTYTDQELSGIVFCEEAENIESLTPVTSGNTNIRASNGAGGWAASDAYITTLQPGKYKLYSALYGNAGTTYKFMAGDVEVLEITTNGNPTHTESEEFEIFEETDIIVPKAGNGGNSPKSIDYIIIQKTGDAEIPANVTATLSDYGYATFASPYALDLDGIEAYYASAVNENSVTLKKAEGTVKAGTGLVLVGSAGDVVIPVAESGDAIEGNLLVGCLKDTELPANSADCYVLSYNNDNVAEFQSLAEWSEAVTVPAGHAYLKVDAPAEGRLAIVFDGTTTGISSIDAMQPASSEVYNLQGQRVEKAVKGLYIVNGKKVLK